MATKYGRDSLGRRYATVNGKRVKVTEDSGPKEEDPRQAVKGKLDSFLRRWFKGTKSHAAISGSISRALKTSFGSWFNVGAKTSVGKFGRAYATARLLALLKGAGVKGFKDDSLDNLIQKYIPHGEVDRKAFFGAMKDAGIEVPEVSKAQEVSGLPADDDAAILRVVHSYGLTSKRLAGILNKELGDPNDRSQLA